MVAPAFIRAMAAASLGYVSALQMAPVLETAQQFKGCSLMENVDFEKKVFGADAQSLAQTQSRICDTLGANGGIDQISFVNHSDSAAPGVQRVIWVSGYPRSGSSTALSLVSATMDDNRDPKGNTFSVFEPCHDGDEYAKWQEQEGCASVLENLAQCDFSGIRGLWGWEDPHTTTGFKDYSSDHAHNLCTNSEVVAFKTVDYGHELKAFKWFLDDLPKLRILDVVRDPRGIFGSWKVLEPFASLIKAGDFYTIPRVCKHFAANLDFQDDRVHRIVFEDLLDDPFNTTNNAYKFLELEFGEQQQHWIEHVFHATWCPPVDPSMEGFTDCHIDAGANKEKWREVLTDEEQKTFINDPDCQRIAKAYGWPAK